MQKIKFLIDFLIEIFIGIFIEIFKKKPMNNLMKNSMIDL